MESAGLCCGVERNVVILLIVHVTKGGGLWCKRAKLQQVEGHCQFMFVLYNPESSTQRLRSRDSEESTAVAAASGAGVPMAASVEEDDQEFR